MKSILRYLLLLAITSQACAQTEKSRINFETYEPPSSLVVPQHLVKKAKFPFIDVHSHQPGMPTQDLSSLLNQMNGLNMQVMVNLSGKGFRNTKGVFDVNEQSYLINAIKNAEKAGPDRFVVFTNISFTGVGESGWIKRAIQQLEEDVKAGAKGLKIYKSLGLTDKDKDGRLLRVDDPRLGPIWEKCGQLGIPVLIHTADPKQFWEEPNEQNERLLELLTYPRRQRSKADPSWDDLIAQQHNIIRKHKNTTFIVAHFGWFANDLNHLGNLLNSFPNMNIEFGAVIAELGRQPRMAKQFFTKYQDRILFGKDSWVPSEYSTYFRVLETEDEYFPYHKKYHAYWKMYGMGLSDEILKKIYYKNALRLIPGINKTQFPE